MSIELWRPWRTMPPWREMEERMERMFEEVFGQPTKLTAPTEAAWLPTVEMFEREGKLVVRADVPGLKREEIAVAVTDSTLTISGERKTEKEIKEEKYYRCERAYGTFRRLLTLPTGVEKDKIEAAYKDGVLEITMPMVKAPEAKKIAIH